MAAAECWPRLVHAQGQYTISTSPTSERPGYSVVTTVVRDDGVVMLRRYARTWSEAVEVHYVRVVRWSDWPTGIAGDE